MEKISLLSFWDGRIFWRADFLVGDEQCPGQISDSSKRLVLFAPYEEEWSVVTENWNNVIHYPSTAGNGLEDLDYKEIIDAIGNSI